MDVRFESRESTAVGVALTEDARFCHRYADGTGAPTAAVFVYPVGHVRGRPGSRTALRHAHEVVVHRHPQQQVGEGEVSEQLPLTDQPLEMIGLVSVEFGVSGEERRQR